MAKHGDAVSYLSAGLGVFQIEPVTRGSMLGFSGDHSQGAA